MEVVNICFSINDLFFIPCCVAVKSILSSKRGEYKIAFYVLYNSLDSKNIKKLKKLVQSHNEEVYFHKVDIKDFEDLPIKKYSQYKYENYFRINIPEIYKDIDKMLYLDSDIVVKSDIKELFDTNIPNSYLACVKEKYQDKNRIIEGLNAVAPEYQLDSEYDYYNSGILLINCKKWREDNTTDRLREFAKLHHYLIYLPDQDTLNYVINKNIVYLDDEWNFQCNFEYSSCVPEGTIKIIHYVGEIKPWTKLSLNKCFCQYYKHLSLFEYKQIISNLYSNLIDWILDLLYVFKLNNKIKKFEPGSEVILFYNTHITDLLLSLKSLKNCKIIAIADPFKQKRISSYKNIYLEYPCRLRECKVKYIINTSRKKNYKEYLEECKSEYYSEHILVD